MNSYPIPEDLKYLRRTIGELIGIGHRVGAISGVDVLIEHIAAAEGRAAEFKRDFFEADSLRATYEDRCGELEGLLREWIAWLDSDSVLLLSDLPERTIAEIGEKK